MALQAQSEPAVEADVTRATACHKYGQAIRLKPDAYEAVYACMIVWSERARAKSESQSTLLFEELAAALDGLAMLNAFPGVADLNPLVAFLQIQVAAARGEFQLATDRIVAWVKMPGYVRSVAIGRGEINAVVLACLEKANWLRSKPISAMPLALSAMGPNTSIDTVLPVSVSMPMPHIATP